VVSFYGDVQDRILNKVALKNLEKREAAALNEFKKYFKILEEKIKLKKDIVEDSINGLSYLYEKINQNFSEGDENKVEDLIKGLSYLYKKITQNFELFF